MRKRKAWQITIGLFLFITMWGSPIIATEKVDSANGVKITQTQAQPNAAPGRDAPLWEKGGQIRIDQMPPIRKLTDGVLAIDKIRIDKRIPLITVPGYVNMQDGLVEYLACGNRGKLHESVLRVEAEPFYLQLAMLLIGLEPTKKPLAHQGESAIPGGDPLEIEVQWVDKNKKRITRKGEDLVYNQQAQKSMEYPTWVFTGSAVINGRFMAQVEHSIAAIYHDPYAVIDNQLPSGSDDRIWFANKSILPEKGTPVTLVIKPRKSSEKQ